ncbi:unnamed protein product, partial [Mycena citricolor]
LRNNGGIHGKLFSHSRCLSSLLLRPSLELASSPGMPKMVSDVTALCLKLTHSANSSVTAAVQHHHHHEQAAHPTLQNDISTAAVLLRSRVTPLRLRDASDTARPLSVHTQIPA